MIEALVQWTQLTLIPFGAWGIGILTFASSSVFPLPPEILLLPMIIFDPANAYFYAGVATVSSTLGSLLGWQIGKKGGKPLLRKFVSSSNIRRATELFENHGAWSLIISGMTPLPYKAFTITAGALEYKDMARFIVACTIGRGVRFFLQAFLLVRFGPQLMPFIEGSLGWVLLAVSLAVLAAWLVAQKLLKSRLA